jgi:hypothetical protein
MHLPTSEATKLYPTHEYLLGLIVFAWGMCLISLR